MEMVPPIEVKVVNGEHAISDQDWRFLPVMTTSTRDSGVLPSLGVSAMMDGRDNTLLYLSTRARN